MRSLLYPRLALALLALLALLATPALTRAGGIEVELDEAALNFQAGVATTVGFSIRSAHEGHDPITGLHPRVVLSSLETKESVTAEAKAEGALGHYVASVTVPSAGRWRWEIRPWGAQDPSGFTMPGPLVVGKPGEQAPVVSKKLQDVKMLDMYFEPASLTIEAGTSVRWVNAGAYPHMVTASDGSFASGNIGAGESFTFTFDAPGTYQYYCDYHATKLVGAADGGARPVAYQSAPAGGMQMVGSIVVTGAKVDAKPAAETSLEVAPAVKQPVTAAPLQPAPSGDTGASLPLVAAVAVVALGLGVAGGWLLGRRRAV